MFEVEKKLNSILRDYKNSNISYYNALEKMIKVMPDNIDMAITSLDRFICYLRSEYKKNTFINKSF